MQAFLDKVNKNLVVEAQNDIIKMLVEKCIGHMKPNIKDKGKECFLMLFEVSEAFDESIDTMLELLKNKNVKVGSLCFDILQIVTSACTAIAALVESYGIKKVKVANFTEVMLKNASNANPACKTAAYDYYKGLYKWIGDAVLPQIEDKLKKIQVVSNVVYNLHRTTSRNNSKKSRPRATRTGDSPRLRRRRRSRGRRRKLSRLLLLLRRGVPRLRRGTPRRKLRRQRRRKLLIHLSSRLKSILTQNLMGLGKMILLRSKSGMKKWLSLRSLLKLVRMSGSRMEISKDLQISSKRKWLQ